MKIDFTKFPMYEGIEKDRVVACDISKFLIDVLYKKVSGIEAHCLSEKIYKAKGIVDLNKEEVEFIKGIAPIFTPCFIDSFNSYVEKYNKEKEVSNEN